MSDSKYLNSGVPKRHRKFQPKDSTNKNWVELYDKIKRKMDDGFLVALVGKRGTGKTQMGSCLIGYCAYKLEQACYYTKALDIFIKIRSGYKLDGETEGSVIGRHLFPKLLVIDAFEVRSETAFENRVINHIIDKRYDAMKSTLIISNDKVETFEDVIGPSICDRMRETGGIVEMAWESFRK